ncbi:MAG TPA: hypothetical protein VK034_16695, partial [Enhygromyxa sp.]|nr:hypothetical protein [Enhygromyxa sp.]
QSRTILALALLTTFACGTERHEQAANSVEIKPGLGPRATPTEAAEPEPEPAPAPEPPVASEPAPELDEPEPELDERKLALRNVGRAAFDALESGDFEALARLTPLDKGPLRDVCPRMLLSNRKELEARFAHCHETIAWNAVAEAQAFAGQPTGAQAAGCDAGIEDYGRLQLFVHMNDAKIWRVDFFGAVGQDGNAIGISGEVACHEVDEAPPL